MLRIINTIKIKSNTQTNQYQTPTICIHKPTLVRKEVDSKSLNTLRASASVNPFLRVIVHSLNFTSDGYLSNKSHPSPPKNRIKITMINNKIMGKRLDRET
jgi:hypothetical protein